VRIEHVLDAAVVEAGAELFDEPPTAAAGARHIKTGFPLVKQSS